MKMGDLVGFKDEAGPEIQSEGGRFCWDKGLTGKVVRESGGYIEIDCQIGYNIFAQPDVLELRATVDEIPENSDL